jgi:hypothetical protein
MSCRSPPVVCEALLPCWAASVSGGDSVRHFDFNCVKYLRAPFGVEAPFGISLNGSRIL